MANQPLEKLLDIRGLGEAMVIRIAACFEMAKRVVDGVVAILKIQPPLI